MPSSVALVLTLLALSRPLSSSLALSRPPSPSLALSRLVLSRPIQRPLALSSPFSHSRPIKPPCLANCVPYPPRTDIGRPDAGELPRSRHKIDQKTTDALFHSAALSDVCYAAGTPRARALPGSMLISVNNPALCTCSRRRCWSRRRRCGMRSTSCSSRSPHRTPSTASPLR